MKSNFKLAGLKTNRLFIQFKNRKFIDNKFHPMVKLLFVLICVLLACSPKKSDQPEIEDSKLNNQELSINDPRFKHALELAHDSLPFFMETFNKFHHQQEYNFFVRSRFVKGDNAERLWAKPFLISANDFKCILDSNPTTLVGYKFGDTVQVDFNAVEDFMIIFGDSIIGNYLLRELQKDTTTQ